MFKVHLENANLLLEDCRAGATGWLRVSVTSHHRDMAGNGAGVEIDEISHVPDEKQASNFLPIHAVYGIYHLLSGPYLAVIKDSRVIGSGPNSEKIFCIWEIDLIPISAAGYRSFFKHASKREKKDELEYCQMIKKVLSSRTFYFSYDYDLTLSAQRKAINTTSSSNKNPMWQRAEDIFFWNKTLLQKFMDQKLDRWIIPVISGFVKVMKKCEINGMRCDVLFFTRRSCKRVGTRFNVRGVDKDGHVANFAETEMLIVKPNRSICSYVQIRGSIPLYWDQLATLKYMPRTRYAFSGNESIVDWNELAFRAHMDTIIQRYGHITVINLIDKIGKSRTVKDQAQLGTAYGKYVKKYNQQTTTQEHSDTDSIPPNTASFTSTGRSRSAASMNSSSGSMSNLTNTITSTSSTNQTAGLFREPIAYVWFDFHHECRQMKWENLSKLMTEVQDQFLQYGWFESDADGRTICRQKGVFRVNCMDNLDRTNVVMSLFARRTTLMALGLYNKKDASVLDSPHESFEVVFKNAWADNADYVSKMYAGTGALKTDFTRTGKRTLAGAIQDGINSVTRYFLNNFADGIRQDSYDLVVANYVPDKRDESPFTFQQQHAFLHFIMEMSMAFLMVIIASVTIRPSSNNNDKDTTATIPTTSLLVARNPEELMSRVRDGAIATVLGLLVVGHLILKKGMFRSLGRRYVCKPAFSSSGYIRKRE